VQKGNTDKVMNQEKFLYGGILCEFELGKTVFIKAREYGVTVVESHHGWCVSVEAYCTGHDVFILCVPCIFHFLMGICFTMNVSNISSFACI